MPREVEADQVVEWIDDDLVEDITQIEDESVEFNIAIQMSGILIHMIRRRPGGPVLVGQTIEFSEEIHSRIRDLSTTARSELVTRVRESLMELPAIYGFRDENDANVAFEEMQQIFIEYRVYPDEISQGRLMRGLIDVWKALRYLDDLPALIDAVDS